MTGYALADEHGGSKEKGINVVCDNGIYDTDAIQVSQLGFCFSRSLKGQKMNRVICVK